MTTPSALGEFVRTVAEVHGWSVRQIRFLENAGAVNHVARLSTSDDDVIVRFHRDPMRPSEFQVEQWCSRAAAAVGVPTATVLAHGVLDNRAYGIQEYVAGRTPAPTEETWTTLGKYARSTATVDLTGAPDGLFGRFGRDLPTAWRSHVEYNLASLGLDDLLIAHEVYALGEAPLVAAILARTLNCGVFGLVHGDLKPQNLIRESTGRLVLIDWGCAKTGPVPWLDAVVISGRRSAEGGVPGSTRWFLRGCRTLQDEEMLDAQRLLSSLDLLRWSLDRRPDLIDFHRQVAEDEVRRVLRRY